jgi:radical SAM protein with 4Fe4S-binding SPASM domain
VHQTREIDFQRVINNLKKAVEFRNKNKLNCTIGVQSVLLPENADEMVNLGKIIRDEIGADYFVIKPFSQEPSSINRLYEDIDYRSMTLRANEKKLKALENENFKVSYRSETMSNYHEDQENRYTTCYSTPIYMAYLMAEGSVYGCKDHLLDTNFCYGNINKNTFTEIWKGERRREGIEYVLNELDVSKCRVNCRMDKVNRYLFDLKEGKVDHMNFI